MMSTWITGDENLDHLGRVAYDRFSILLNTYFYINVLGVDTLRLCRDLFLLKLSCIVLALIGVFSL